IKRTSKSIDQAIEHCPSCLRRSFHRILVAPNAVTLRNRNQPRHLPHHHGSSHFQKRAREKERRTSHAAAAPPTSAKRKPEPMKLRAGTPRLSPTALRRLRPRRHGVGFR